ncbi:MAG: DNA-binding protein WhiA [Clostridia bacterium]|nr:DNA-binding protein WhiA [Clostridia bacterium]
MKTSYSALIREELTGRTLTELGIAEKGKERFRPCCAASFLRGAYLCVGRETEGILSIPARCGALSDLCRHLLSRFYEEDPLPGDAAGLSPALADTILSRSPRETAGCEECPKAFLRAAFLACGTVTDPAKGYRAVFRCRDERAAKEIRDALRVFSLSPGTSRREKGLLVYLKRGEEICDLLVAIGDQRHAIQLQEHMVETSFRSAQNRRQNSDLANVQKAVNGAQSAISAIRYLSGRGLMNTLPEPLREAARIRLENPDLTLKELCRAFPGSISKSGLNHRLQKLVVIARDAKEKEKKS